jgi:capsular exopolysaccharide synthesis family protein
MSAAQDRRLQPRCPVPDVAAKVAVVGESRRGRGVELVDLSADGVRWRDTTPLDKGTRIRLTLRTRRFFGGTLQLDAAVVWQDHNGIAARFLDHTDRGGIERYLRRLQARMATAPQAEGDSAAAAAFGLLGLALEKRAQNGSRVVVIASARPADGKSHVTAGIAAALARMGRRVLVVDADLHAPTQHLRFFTTGAPGLAQALHAREGDLRELVQVSQTGVAVLPAGAVAVAPGLFSHDALSRVSAALRTIGYPLVLIDCPPLLTAAETLAFAQIADETLLTVRAGSTRERDVKLALALLERNGTPASGIVLNDHSDPVTSSGGGVQGPYRAVAIPPESSTAASAAVSPPVSAWRAGGVT